MIVGREHSIIDYSENDMANAFVILLQSSDGLPSVGVFDAVYREISCRQGKPDFIALRHMVKGNPSMIRTVPGIVAPAILNCLKPKAPRTMEYIINNVEFTRESVKKTIQKLVDLDYVEKTDSGSYRHAGDDNDQKCEIWSFELKLSDTKKAVFQAQQSRAFADRSIIVVPPGQERNYERFGETIQRWKIGLAVFDIVTGSFRFIRKGRKSKALSQTHRLYALSQIHADGKAQFD